MSTYTEIEYEEEFIEDESEVKVLTYHKPDPNPIIKMAIEVCIFSLLTTIIVHVAMPLLVSEDRKRKQAEWPAVEMLPAPVFTFLFFAVPLYFVFNSTIEQ